MSELPGAFIPAPKWDTTELQRDFEVIGFLAPYVVVRRKSDGKKGSLMFSGRPRYYYHWQEDNVSDYVNRQGNRVIVTRSGTALRVEVKATVPTSARALNAQMRAALVRATQRGAK